MVSSCVNKNCNALVLAAAGLKLPFKLAKTQVNSAVDPVYLLMPQL